MDKSRNLIKVVFGLDNGLMRAAERVFDLILLNVLFVLTASFVVTLGLAKIALYRSLVDLKHRGKLPIISTYFGHLKANWRQGLVLGVVELTLTAFTLFDLYLIRSQEGLAFQLLAILAYGVFFLTLVTHLYLYPLVGTYQLPLKELYVKALLLASLNVKWTIVFILGLVLSCLVLQLSSLTFLLGSSFFLIIGCAAVGYAYVVIILAIFDRWLR